MNEDKLIKKWLSVFGEDVDAKKLLNIYKRIIPIQLLFVLKEKDTVKNF